MLVSCKRFLVWCCFRLPVSNCNRVFSLVCSILPAFAWYDGRSLYRGPVFRFHGNGENHALTCPGILPRSVWRPLFSRVPLSRVFTFPGTNLPSLRCLDYLQSVKLLFKTCLYYPEGLYPEGDCLVYDGASHRAR